MPVEEPTRGTVMTDSIRIRVCLVVVENGRILLVPHYGTDAGEIQWAVPGGMVEFGEVLETAVTREFLEETGLNTEVTSVLCVSEVILPERPYHSITISFSGQVIGGDLRAEETHPFGTKTPRWFSATELATAQYYPEKTVEMALGINRR
jgi:ADP-ribose pyrophosphatase YjhB (NUDIX family)